MKHYNFIILLAITIIASACSNKISVETEYSRATNFNDFKYYRWHQYSFDTEADKQKDTTKTEIKGDQTKPKKQIDKHLDQKIRFMVDKQLAEKNMIKKEYGPVDFLVHYTVASDSKADVEQQRVYDTYATNFQTYGGGYSYAGNYYSGIGMGRTIESSTREEMMVKRYKEGMMSLDFHEPETKNLIWSATGEKRLSYDKLEPAERDKLINKMIGKLLANFPPK